MTKLRFYLDKRRPHTDGCLPLALAITHKRAVRYIFLGIYISAEHWDAAVNKVALKHPASVQLNKALTKIMGEAEAVLYDTLAELRPFNIKEIRAKIAQRLGSMQAEVPVDKTQVIPTFERFAATKKKSTRDTYERTLKHIRAFVPSGRLTFDEITLSWLQSFDAHLAKSSPSPNGRALHMRNLRAVINYAIDEGITANYPFRRYRIKTVKTVKRALKVEELRTLLTAEVEPWQEPYRDFFMLSFYTIGANAVDLMRLTSSSIINGRAEYYRAKTGRLYSIKLEPEAAALIDKYKGSTLLLKFGEGRSDYLQFIRQANRALRSIGMECKSGRKRKGKSLFPKLTTYWARHTWATIARSLGISVDDIALALGHGDGHELTHIYLDEDLQRIDEANRRVIDWVLKAKK